jgi:hypothetical protein
MLATAATGSDRATSNGLRVNASTLAAWVWESNPWALAAPPRCNTKSADGIGRWRCSYTFLLSVELEDFAPVPPGPTPALPKKPDTPYQRVTVRVTPRGAIVGRGLDGRRFNSCCMRLR